MENIKNDSRKKGKTKGKNKNSEKKRGRTNYNDIEVDIALSNSPIVGLLCKLKRKLKKNCKKIPKNTKNAYLIYSQLSKTICNG